MKLTKKKVLLVSLAVCLVAIVSFGTLAWFTADDTVVNEFYVGNSQVTPDKVFGIDLWEEDDLDGDGVTEEHGRGVANTTGHKYEEILPGQALDKDPYLTNTGIHPMYVRAIVTVTEADILKDAMIPKYSEVSEWHDVAKFLPGTGDKWSLEYKFHTNDDKFVFVYYYTEVLNPASDPTDPDVVYAEATTQKIFDDVVIPTELTKEQAAKMDNFTITIVGEAIQSDHLDPALIADAIANGETVAKAVFAKYWDEPGFVAGIEQNPTVTVSYPMTGNYGTITKDLVTYDPANYTDPATAGNLVIQDFTATIKAGASLVVIPAEQNNSSIQIWGATLTIEDGGAIVTADPAAHTVYVMKPIVINGVEMDSSNWSDMVAKYFVGYDASQVWKMY